MLDSIQTTLIALQSATQFSAAIEETTTTVFRENLNEEKGF